MVIDNKPSHMKPLCNSVSEDTRIAAQHARGKLTSLERINLLLDPNTFQEIAGSAHNHATDANAPDTRNNPLAVITGSGKINGRPVFLFSQDFSIIGGTISEAEGQKIAHVTDLALEHEAPIIGIYDSGGARIQEGVASLAGVGEILLRNTRCSGAIPQIAVVVGPSAGGSAYSPSLCDFVFTVKNITQMYITGPDVVKSVTNETISHQELGGAEIHSQKSGVAHFVHDSEEECFRQVRRLLSFIPQSCNSKPQTVKTDDPTDRCDETLQTIVPDDPRKPYDMKKIIAAVVDNGALMEVQSQFARNIICGMARLAGNSVGIVAQQPAMLAGVIDINASVKAARFVRFCDAFNIPIVSFVDVPGFMPGTEQEHGGIIRHGAKLIYAYAEATVPKLSVITRKAYGGAYIAMSSQHLRSDINYAWKGAIIAVMGTEAAVNIIFHKMLAESPTPEETRQKLAREYSANFGNTLQASKHGYIDGVIDPRQTRPMLIHALETLHNKQQKVPQKKHGNMPL
ncbi:MAG: acyl-CoA carboxylase subunit beta [Dehalococcoidia bacterium]|nr:acyl-CoA carboxylase subunit beta [Dehalococcoidia bacterium]